MSLKTIYYITGIAASIITTAVGFASLLNLLGRWSGF
jgi:hypothetical protein